MNVGLMGSGEFEPWSADVDRWLLARVGGGPGRVLILPTASAQEGDDVFDGWAVKGLEHFAEMGVRADALPLKTAEDAGREELVAELDNAAMVFFSGGNPWYLSEVLRGSPFLGAMQRRMGDGLAYAGCSAGVACLTERTYDSDTQDFEQVFKPGLGLVRGALFGPHWDIVDSWIPGASEFIVSSVRSGETFVGIDENTAMVGDGGAWSVMGMAAVHVFRDGTWNHHGAGASFDLPLWS